MEVSLNTNDRSQVPTTTGTRETDQWSPVGSDISLRTKRKSGGTPRTLIGHGKDLESKGGDVLPVLRWKGRPINLLTYTIGNVHLTGHENRSIIFHNT